MLDRARRQPLSWAGRLGQPVTLHVGIHTGPVVAGNLGGGRRRRLRGDRRHREHDGAALTGGAPRNDSRVRGHPCAHAAPLRVRAGRRAGAPRQVGAGRRPSPSSARSPSPDRPAGSRRSGSRRCSSDGPTSSINSSAAFDRMQRGRAQVGEPGRRGRARASRGSSRSCWLGSMPQARLAGTADPPGRLLVAGRADLRRLRGALPGSLSSRRSADSLDVARQKLAAGLRALGRPRRGGEGHRAGAELRARAGGGSGPVTSSPSSSSARSRWPRARWSSGACSRSRC